MAIRVRAQLRKWFGRGMYPTAEQFSDLFDSFFHKTEDKIPMSGVEGLTDQLNGKYNTAEGRELEKKVQKVTDDLSAHVASSEKAFNEVQNDIEALDGRLDDEIERAKGEEAAIRRELAAGDAATLSSAKSYTDTSVAAEAGKREQGDATTLQAAKTYTDTSVAAEAEERTQGDATTLSSAKTYTDTSVADEAQKRGQGDAATLQSANSHADAAVASEKSARESGDRTTLESAKAYVDKAIAELVDGSPAALDTLKELSAALGNDPNFATTVATQIGQKVDKVAGKGLSTEDYTSEEKAKLAGVAAGANNYQHPATHPATMIEQDASHRFVTDTEKDRWNAVSPSVPNLIWKVSEGSFLIKPSCSLDDPILAQCYIGFIRYKRRRNRKDRRVKPYRDRPDDIGYHLVDTDDFPKPEWAVEKLSPIPFDIEQAKASNGWMRVNKVRTICARFIEEVADSTYARNIRLIIHNGTSTDTKLNMGKDKYGLIKQFASVRCGIVMFTGKPEKRIEGNRSYFKACCSNVGSGYFLR